MAVRKSASEMTGLGFGGYYDRLSIIGCRDKTKLAVKDKTQTPRHHLADDALLERVIN